MPAPALFVGYGLQLWNEGFELNLTEPHRLDPNPERVSLVEVRVLLKILVESV